MNYLTARFLKWQIENAVPYLFDLVLEDFLGASVAQGIVSFEVLGLEPFDVNIRLQFHNVEHFPLQTLQALLELLILRTDALVRLFLRLRDHEVHVGLG